MMMLAMMLATATIWAEDITYIERSWNGSVVTETEKTVSGYTVLNSTSGESISLTSGNYYVVKGNAKYSQIAPSGTAHLILCDGAKLEAQVLINNGNTLHIYAQSAGTGQLVANGKSNAAGIGSSEDKNMGTLTVHGGRITAHGDKYAAGIGGGENGDGGKVTIYAGTVNAYGGTDAAGIGGGEDGDGGSLTVYGGSVYADGTGWGAGIGAGEDGKGATVVVEGGSVVAWAGSDAGDKNGSAIGSEDGEGRYGSLDIGDNMMVYAGSNPSSATVFSSGARVSACRWRPYARIEPCKHAKATYTLSGATANDTHTLNCPNCLVRTESKHTFESGVCTVCKVSGDISTVSIYLPERVGDSYTDGHYATTPRTQKLVKGSNFNLPLAHITYLPSGVTFVGWRVGTPEELGITSYWDDGSEGLLAPGAPYTVNSDISLTARYSGLKVSLPANAKNSEALSEDNGKKAETVTLAGSTLIKDGSWHTLCLPFSVTIAGSPLDGAVVREINSMTFDTDNKLTLTSTAVTAIEAGKPYIIKWSSGAQITDPVFSSVTINSAAPTSLESSDGKFKFAGTYDVLGQSEKTNTMLDANNPNGYAFHATLSAEADAGYIYEWYTAASGAGPQITTLPFDADGNATMYAKLVNTNTYTITASASPADFGSVTGDGQYYEGEEVKLTATPNEGKRFVNWTESGTEVSTDAVYTFPATAADRTFVANFADAIALTITAKNATKQYDGTTLTENGYTSTGLAEGDAIESVTVTGSQLIVGRSANVPSQAVIKKGDTDVTANYAITYVNGTLTVTKRNIDYADGTITQDENGFAVSLTENSASAHQLPAAVDGTVTDLDYSRTVSGPGSGSGDLTLSGLAANLYTVCLPFVPATGTGVTYYTFSSVDGSTLKFTEVASPAACTPYLMAVTGSNTITESCSDQAYSTSATIHSNSTDGFTFTGTLSGMSNADAITAAGSNHIYILQHQAKWGKITNANPTAVYIPPFRAFIIGPAVSAARELNSSFGDDDATGIRHIQTIDADGTERWYDLNGRRIDKPTRKGIYIRNGKKTTSFTH